MYLAILLMQVFWNCNYVKKPAKYLIIEAIYLATLQHDGYQKKKKKTRQSVFCYVSAHDRGHCFSKGYFLPTAVRQVNGYDGLCTNQVTKHFWSSHSKKNTTLGNSSFHALIAILALTTNSERHLCKKLYAVDKKCRNI